METPRLFDSQSDVLMWTVPVSMVSIRSATRCLANVLSTTDSVFSGFKHSPFKSSQRRSALIQSVNLDKVTPFTVSSAYGAWSAPNEMTTLATADMYEVNNKGPRTEPCRTPHSQLVLNDCSCPTDNVRSNLVHRRS